MRVGIIAAMEVETNLLCQALKSPVVKCIAGVDLWEGVIGNHEVAVMLCGMGKVSAALGAQALIDDFHPDYLINTGCAGGIGKGLVVGDMVLSDRTAEWDLDITVLGLPRGFVSSLNGVYAEADATLNSMIRAAYEADLAGTETKVLEGLVVSGDQFVSSDAQRELILGSFPDALCTEMEGAAIGHVCAQNKVAFTVVRCMSDTADSHSEMDFPSFAKLAGEKSAKLLIKMLGA